jgi:hypothetical protein
MIISSADHEVKLVSSNNLSSSFCVRELRSREDQRTNFKPPQKNTNHHSLHVAQFSRSSTVASEYRVFPIPVREVALCGHGAASCSRTNIRLHSNTWSRHNCCSRGPVSNTRHHWELRSSKDRWQMRFSRCQTQRTPQPQPDRELLNTCALIPSRGTYPHPLNKPRNFTVHCVLRHR